MSSIFGSYISGELIGIKVMHIMRSWWDFDGALEKKVCLPYNFDMCF